MFQGPKGYIAKYVKYTCSMETVQQNGRFTFFSNKFHSNIYSILFDQFIQKNPPNIFAAYYEKWRLTTKFSNV